MAYCTNSDVALSVPAAGGVSGSAPDFTDYIAAAQITIDAILRENYSVPFDEPVDPLIADINARLAAGRYISAKYAKGAPEENTHGRSLVKEALAALDDIKSNPSLIATDMKTAASDETGGVLTAGENPIFDLGDPSGWGRS